MKNTQTSYGAWQARWGINYIYGMGCIIPALSRMGYDLTEDWIARSIEWLLSKQNEDGGYGETTLSYNDEYTYNGVGKSTVS